MGPSIGICLFYLDPRVVLFLLGIWFATEDITCSISFEDID